MSTSARPKKIEFAPGVLEQMEKDFTPDELQEVMDELKRMMQPEYVDTNSVAVDMKQLMREDPDTYRAIQEALERVDEADSPPTLQ